jgi:hypothetical protein
MMSLSEASILLIGLMALIPINLANPVDPVNQATLANLPPFP